MPSAVSSEPGAAPPDDLDELFNFDAGIDEALGGSHNRNEHAVDASASRGGDNAAEIDMDEEIVVTKRRQPIAKMDEERYVRCYLLPYPFLTAMKHSIRRWYSATAEGGKENALQGQRPRGTRTNR